MRTRTLLPVALLCLAGCTTSGDGEVTPQESNLTVTNGSALQFRKVGTTVPPGPATGTPGASRQSTDPKEQTAAAQALDCDKEPPTPAVPDLPLVACDPLDSSRLVLDPQFLAGTEAATVSAQQDAQSGGRWVLYLEFKPAGAATFGQFTTNNTNERVAIVVGGKVVSAPSIQAPILDGRVQITGMFTDREAVRLAHAIAGN